jgi:hypothetical protein
VFIRVNAHRKISSSIVHPSVAPSKSFDVTECAMSHGYKRVFTCKAGMNGSCSGIHLVVLTSWHDCHEFRTHTSEDEHELHSVAIGKVAYRS